MMLKEKRKTWQRFFNIQTTTSTVVVSQNHLVYDLNYAIKMNYNVLVYVDFMHTSK